MEGDIFFGWVGQNQHMSNMGLAWPGKCGQNGNVAKSVLIPGQAKIILKSNIKVMGTKLTGQTTGSKVLMYPIICLIGCTKLRHFVPFARILKENWLNCKVLCS